jgi:hypothetical protein
MVNAPADLPPGITRYPLYRRLDRPQGRSGRVLKMSPPPVFDPRTVQLVASRYTDWAIAAHERRQCKVLNWNRTPAKRKLENQRTPQTQATHFHYEHFILWAKKTDVNYRPLLRRAYHPSRGVSEVYLNGGPGPLRTIVPWKTKIIGP